MTSTEIMLKACYDVRKETGKTPLVVGYELYVFFGDTVSITETTSLVGPKVMIINRFGEQTEVDFSELELRQQRFC